MKLHADNLAEEINIDAVKSLRGAELAQAILESIEKSPRSHSQLIWGETWECGTTMCIAGWAAFLADEASFEFTGRNEYPEYRLRTKSGDLFSIVSGELLGLDAENADRLFFTLDNDAAMDALRYVAEGKAIDWSKIYLDHPEYNDVEGAGW